MDKRTLVTLRDWEEGDRNFVLATMLRGLYYGDTWFREIPKDIFMAKYHEILDRILKAPQVSVIVACLREDPDVILGYTILSPNSKGSTMHWVFVKSAWRNIGIAKMLTPKDLTTVTHLTKVGLTLLRKTAGVEFNPFL